MLRSKTSNHLTKSHDPECRPARSPSSQGEGQKRLRSIICGLQYAEQTVKSMVIAPSPPPPADSNINILCIWIEGAHTYEIYFHLTTSTLLVNCYNPPCACSSVIGEGSNRIVCDMPVDVNVHSECLSFIQSLSTGSVDLVMTPPPYWNLRDYGVDGQIGLECHPLEYIHRLSCTFHEIKRVLKNSGSFYLNIGDSYFGSNTRGPQKEGKAIKWPGLQTMPNNRDWGLISDSKWLQHKQLLGIPERVMIAMQEDGWILRNKNVWWKRNHLPSSVMDRLTSAYEYVYHFVKSRRYYYDLDAIRVPIKQSTRERMECSGYGKGKAQLYLSSGQPKRDSDIIRHFARRKLPNPKGANPGDVWDVTLKPFHGPHFAIYPPDLCIKPILSSCPPGGIVFDPFSGSGTTLCAAKALGRRYLGCDLNPNYVEMAMARLERVKPPTAPIRRLIDGLVAVKRI